MTNRQFADKPPEAWAPLYKLARLARRPLDRFLRIEAASGIILIVAALLALVWANSSGASAYRHLWHTSVGLRIGDWEFTRSLEWVVNDLLMVVFFFVVGMEIRREIHHGELSEWRRALLPLLAALGGMLAPAGIYLLFAGDGETHHGWGVPTATDIAFALGVLALLGKRVPPALRVLLLALAVIDDLGAIVVIALFYSDGVVLSSLALAAVGIASIVVLQRAGMRSRLWYVVPAFLVWLGVYGAHIHPTIAGVIVGLLTPVRAWLAPEALAEHLGANAVQLAEVAAAHNHHELGGQLQTIDRIRREAVSPAEGLIELLHPWVAFVIMPIFALANSGVNLSGISLTGDANRVLLGVTMGLVAGKAVGVCGACWLAVKSKLCTLPAGLSVRHLIVLGTVAGIGFTMSLFIAQLAFRNPSFLGAAKVGILAASVIAAVIALTLGRLLLPTVAASTAAATADEAEASTEM